MDSTLFQEQYRRPDASINLLATGSSEAFVHSLLREVEGHAALDHPYLHGLSSGSFPNMKEVFKDYAHQYSYYSGDFLSYLNGVVNTLELPTHVESIMENVEEEKGDKFAIELAEKPHVEIFNHFKNMIGVDDEYEKKHPISTTVSLWRNLFLQKCNSNIQGVGIGAIGIATENIVPHIYGYLLKGIEEHLSLPKDAGFFFELHIECDDGHGEKLIEITTEIAESFETREAIRFGVFSALNLRSAFWDSQYARAMSMKI